VPRIAAWAMAMEGPEGLDHPEPGLPPPPSLAVAEGKVQIKTSTYGEGGSEPFENQECPLVMQPPIISPRRPLREY
jgi:hypothetical protein